MIPIYEQGTGNGIGHSQDSFIERFDAICKEHIAAGRAKAFAFVFYKFTDAPLKKILRNQGVFAQLDRLAGSDLSVFYLHTGNRDAVEEFNEVFLRTLNIQDHATLPCVVFFRVTKDQITDVEIAQLDSTDLIHGFKELYEAIERYKLEQQPAKSEARWLKWAKSSGQFVSLELFRTAIKKALEYVVF